MIDVGSAVSLEDDDIPPKANPAAFGFDVAAADFFVRRLSNKFC
jgi:hypothetical protein